MLKNYDTLVRQLNRFRYIEPDANFAKKSRALIVGVNPIQAISLSPSLSRVQIYAALVSFAVIVLVAFVSGLSLFSSPIQSLNTDALQEEFKELSINIQLQEVRFQEALNQTIVSALYEVSDTTTRHLNSDILEKEMKGFESSDVQEPNAIDDLLNTIIF